VAVLAVVLVYWTLPVQSVKVIRHRQVHHKETMLVQHLQAIEPLVAVAVQELLEEMEILHLQVQVERD
jgi:hypothetical protein